MNDDVLRDMLRRLSDAEDRGRFRHGTVTTAAPLAVALGGSSVSYSNVRSIAGPLAVGDDVAAWTFGNDIIVLGALTEVPETPRVIGAGGQPAFQNAWVNFGGTEPSASFYKDRGRVYLAGSVKSGTVGAVPMFTLPSGYRPPVDTVRFPVVDGVGTGTLLILANGEVRLSAGNNAYVSLAPVNFRVT